MKIFDCFTLFNELDLLEFRLKYLDAHVDHFIIAESNLTFTGKEKPYNFKDNETRFAQWKHKIIYLPLQQTTEGLTFNEDEKSYNLNNGSWQLEYGQRNYLSAVNNKINDDDIVMIGDIDEIPDINSIQKIRSVSQMHVLQMRFHYYFMNCRNSTKEKWWNGTIICTGAEYKKSIPQSIRDMRNSLPKIEKTGWHFSYLGGIEKIRYKLQSFAHTEYNKEQYYSDENIIKALENGDDILMRDGYKYEFVALSKYPKTLQEIMLQYPQFIKPIKQNIFQKLFS